MRADQKTLNCPWCGSHLQAIKERLGRDLHPEALQPIGQSVSYLALKQLLETPSACREELLAERTVVVGQMDRIISPRTGGHLAEVVITLGVAAALLAGFNGAWNLLAGILSVGVVLGITVFAVRRSQSGVSGRLHERLSDMDDELSTLAGDMAKCKGEMEGLSKSTVEWYSGA